MMEFIHFLVSKKIDSQLFQKSDPILFEEWQMLFDELHEDSFVSQKKFSINNIRRKYLIVTSK